MNLSWSARGDLSGDYLDRWPVHPDDLVRWLDTCVRAFDARETFEIEYRLRLPGGAYQWVRDRGQPRYDFTGAFLGYTGTCVGIEPRDERYEAPRREHRRVSNPAAEGVEAWASNLRERVGEGSEAVPAIDAFERALKPRL